MATTLLNLQARHQPPVFTITVDPIRAPGTNKLDLGLE
jgi:hypothetical protein